MPKKYGIDQLRQAVVSVNAHRLTIAQAAREYSVPRMTVSDHVRQDDRSSVTGPQRMLNDEEENALVTYMKYMASHGFPLTREMTRCYVKEIVRRSGRVTLLYMERGPSHTWFKKLLARHPELSEKKPEKQDKSRSRMSNINVINKYFDFFADVVEENGLQDKPAQIFNCDETGWSGKEASRQKVMGVKRKHTYQQRVTTADHVTAHLCVSAEGRFLPTMVIFKGSLPHRQYRDGVPNQWAYATSESGYMDTELFIQWFQNVFVPNCGNDRPVILVMDNHDSHISLQVVEAARAERTILVGLPAHTTHILQPLDVRIIGPLKERFAVMANKLGFASQNMVIGKAKFPVVLNYAIDQATPASIKEAFRMAGTYPVDRSAIDQSQIVPALFPPHDTEPATADTIVSDQRAVTCETCGSFLTNPLVQQGLIPESLADLLLPPPGRPSQVKKRKIVTEGRVLSGEKMLEILQEKERTEQKKKQDQEERKLQREIKQEEKKEEAKRKDIKKKERNEKQEERKREKELKQKRKRNDKGRNNVENATEGEVHEKKVTEETDSTIETEGQKQGRLAHRMYTCGVCHIRGRVTDDGNGIKWYGCDDPLCLSGTGWFHEDCLSEQERNILHESLQDESVFWYCHFCMPYQYDEE